MCSCTVEYWIVKATEQAAKVYGSYLLLAGLPDTLAGCGLPRIATSSTSTLKICRRSRLWYASDVVAEGSSKFL